MNGLLHLGHAFSLSKAEFATAYARLRGAKALFPFSFHCTGMPIKAAADKIARELALHGGPPPLPSDAAEEAAVEEKQQPSASSAAPVPAGGDPTQFKGKKSKAAAKGGKAGASQWDIMRLSGLDDADIPSFADPVHWLRYFPPLGMRDVTALGCGVDWRRSFVTTDVNPFYDSFVAWQFRKLHAAGKVVRDKRYAVFSPLDGQPCADHDRASGEGVGPQEYTLILLPVSWETLDSRAGGAAHVLAPLRHTAPRVCLAAATLRPETMYGQTNCWVLPEGKYAAFRVVSGDIVVMTHRAALNMSYQERTAGAPGHPECVLDDIAGEQLVGTPVNPPLGTMYKVVYALPMLSIVTSKGTGIVTSVPSDAPDDFVALQDLKQKPALRAKYNVDDSWVLPFEPVPIINIPGIGDLSAPAACAELKIKSQNDRVLLDEAKHRTYLKGFTDGVLLVGPHAGTAVKDAKPVIRGEMMASGGAVPYAEPEKPVLSRSGDECVVALTDQWYVQYGVDTPWRDATDSALSKLNCYHDEARHAFEHTLGWLRQWACSRSFGLGTRLPFDPAFVIESLSDSTIYMAFYTVAHLLQRGDMYGSVDSHLASKLTDAVWDHIFLDGPHPGAECGVPDTLLAAMRREFNFWYPFDMRVSGKDLIGNHLTFSLYTHTAIWSDQPGRWPRGVRCNGHLLLNGDKMSKSTGNFLTLQQAIAEYSADGVRIALADAGDGLDDANFESATANAAVLRLTKELTWLEELTAELNAGKLRTGPLTFADNAFCADLDHLVAAAATAFEATQFREALKAAFFDLHNARDSYRLLCGDAGFHAHCAARYCDVQARVLAPIAPHWCDHVWTTVLNNEGSILKAGWPVAGAPNAALRAAAAYLHDVVTDWRKLAAKAVAPPKGGKGGAQASPAVKLVVSAITVFVKPVYTGQHACVLSALAGAFTPPATFSAPADALLATAQAAAHSSGAPFDVKTMLPFLKFKMGQAMGTQPGGGAVGVAALALAPPYDEAAVLVDNAAYIAKAVGVRVNAFDVVVLHTAADVDAAPAAARAGEALPGKPAVFFATVESA